MELIRKYNGKFRANNLYASEDSGNINKSVVIYSDDFSSVIKHIISNFLNIILLGHNTENVYIQNASKRVKYALEVAFENIIEGMKSNHHESDLGDIPKLFM